MKSNKKYEKSNPLLNNINPKKFSEIIKKIQEEKEKQQSELSQDRGIK